MIDRSVDMRIQVARLDDQLWLQIEGRLVGHLRHRLRGRVWGQLGQLLRVMIYGN